MPTTQRESVCVRSNATRYLVLLELFLPTKTHYFGPRNGMARKSLHEREFAACVTGGPLELGERKAILAKQRSGDAEDTRSGRVRPPATAGSRPPTIA